MGTPVSLLSPSKAVDEKSVGLVKSIESIAACPKESIAAKHLTQKTQEVVFLVLPMARDAFL